VREWGSFPSFAQRVTVLGETWSMSATSAVLRYSAGLGCAKSPSLLPVIQPMAVYAETSDLSVTLCIGLPSACGPLVGQGQASAPQAGLRWPEALSPQAPGVSPGSSGRPSRRAASTAPSGCISRASCRSRGPRTPAPPWPDGKVEASAWASVPSSSLAGSRGPPLLRGIRRQGERRFGSGLVGGL
jgi:hypothetical protein